MAVVTFTCRSPIITHFCVWRQPGDHSCALTGGCGVRVGGVCTFVCYFHVSLCVEAMGAQVSLLDVC